MKYSLFSGGVISAWVLLSAGACVEDDDGPGGMDGGAAGAVESTGGSGESGGAGGDVVAAGGSAAGGSAGEGGTAGGSAGEGGAPFCYADFPCFGREAECVDARHFQRVKDVDCHEACGPGPCGGGSCVPTGAVMECPEGTECVDVPSGVDLTAVCRGDGSGGAGGGAGTGVCGNAELDVLETCDDGNARSGDGCSKDCQVEEGWVCRVVGKPCLSRVDPAPCSAAACWGGDACIEPDSGVTCACPELEPEACGDVVFRSLPLLEGTNNCWARGISGDGMTVVGLCFRSEEGLSSSRGVVWHVGSGLLTLDSGPTATNHDGSVIVGANVDGQAFRATGGEIEIIAESGFPWDTNADGTVVIGDYAEGGFVWTTTAGLVPLQSPSSTRTEAYPRAVSDDGNVIVGSASIADDHAQAVRWNSSGEPEWLPVPDEATDSVASGVNADGSLIVGGVTIDGALRAVRWIEGVYEELPTGEAGSVQALSADGAVLFGSDVGGVTWRYSDAAGREDLKELLTQAGANLENWPTLGVFTCSADGKVVAGVAQYAGVDQNGSQRVVIGWLP